MFKRHLNESMHGTIILTGNDISRQMCTMITYIKKRAKKGLLIMIYYSTDGAECRIWSYHQRFNNLSTDGTKWAQP